MGFYETKILLIIAGLTIIVDSTPLFYNYNLGNRLYTYPASYGYSYGYQQPVQTAYYPNTGGILLRRTDNSYGSNPLNSYDTNLLTSLLEVLSGTQKGSKTPCPWDPTGNDPTYKPEDDNGDETGDESNDSDNVNTDTEQEPVSERQPTDDSGNAEEFEDAESNEIPKNPNPSRLTVKPKKRRGSTHRH